jgi:acyl-CoA synthetase (AMP-forming)/AMP-acid ligase II
MSIDERREATDAFDCALRDCYGQAEAGGPITLLDAVRDFGAQRGESAPALESCGRPLLGVEVAVRDDDDRPLGSNDVGRVFVRSGSLMRGYDANPEATAEVLSDGWLRTGDMGFVDDEGYVHLVDRETDMIIRGGQNVYPAEVERVLREHPAVEDAAVVGRPEASWGEVPVAFVVTGGDGDADGGAVLEFAAGRLARYKRPVEVRTVDELPRNAAGKVLKKILREEAREREAERV